jgi:hypothetical protein
MAMSANELNAPEQRLIRQSKEFRQDYARELRQLLGRAGTEKHRVAIVVFGLINFESYSKVASWPNVFENRTDVCIRTWKRLANIWSLFVQLTAAIYFGWLQW